MKKNYIRFFFLLGTYFAYGQNVQWQKDITSPSQDFLSNLSYTLDQQIFIAGSGINPENTSSDKGNYDYRVIKLSQKGDVLWEKFYGNSGHDYLKTSLSTREGGLLLAGTRYPVNGFDQSNGKADIWLVRLSEEGNKLWESSIGTLYDDDVSSIVETDDKGFFIAGNTSHHPELFGAKDIILTQLSKEGKVINSSIIGGEGLDEVVSMEATKDGGVIVLAYTRSNTTSSKDIESFKSSIQKSHKTTQTTQNYSSDSSSNYIDSDYKITDLLSLSTNITSKNQDGYGEGDYWLIKFSAKGKVEWQKTYGGANDDYPRKLVVTNQGYLVAGESLSSSSGNKTTSKEKGSDVWTIMVNQAGELLWEKSYSIGDRDILMSLETINERDKNNKETSKGFLLGGYTQNDDDKVAQEEETFWMLYIDSEGQEKWKKHIEGEKKQKRERLVSAKLQSDGTYLLAGTSTKEVGYEHLKIVKLGDKELEKLIQKQEVRIYPNPAQEYTYVDVGFEFKEANIALYDMSGKQVQTLKTQNPVTKIDTSKLPQGVYIIKIQSENKAINAKIIKQ